MIDRDSVTNLIRAVTTKLFDEDEYLLKHNARQVALSFKLAWHLMGELPNCLTGPPPDGLSEWPQYTVDAEFNINRGKTKESRIYEPPSGEGEGVIGAVIPDIVVHERGDAHTPQVANLLAIEVKRQADSGMPTGSKLSGKQNAISCVGYPLFYNYALYLHIRTNAVTPRVVEARLISRLDYERLESPRPSQFLRETSPPSPIRDLSSEARRPIIQLSDMRRIDPETRDRVARQKRKEEELFGWWGPKDVVGTFF